MEQYDQIGARLSHLPLARFHYHIFGIISFSLLLMGSSSYSGNVVLAKLVSNGWSNNSLNAALTSVLMFGYFISSLTGGFVGGYFGRHRVLRINLLIVGIAATGAAFAPDIHWLIFFRFLMGAGMGALIMAGYVSFTEFIPVTVRGKWSARFSFVGNWSSMFSVAIGVVVTAFFSWRITFLLGGISILLAWLLLGKYFIESPRWLTGEGQIAGARSQLREVEQQIEREKSVRLPPLILNQSNSKVKVIEGTLWLLFKGEMSRHTLVTITVLIAMNISFHTITVRMSTIFVNSGIDVDKSILMTAIIMIGAPVGILIAVLTIDHFPRRLFNSALLIIIAVSDYIYSIQIIEWAILICGLVMIFFLYMHVYFASTVYIPELWLTHPCLRGSGFVNTVGWIIAVFTPYGAAALLTHYGSTTVFMVFGVVLVFCALVLSISGIEIREVSLEEISEVS